MVMTPARPGRGGAGWGPRCSGSTRRSTVGVGGGGTVVVKVVMG